MSKLEREEVLALFDKTGALLSGHFELSSGLHSPNYLQCAKVLQFPVYAHKLCKALAEPVKDRKIDVVIGAATGGIIISFLMAYYLKCRSIFVERKDEKLLLRRGFELKAGEKVLIVEDVITTGGTIEEMMGVIKENKALIGGLCSLINRSRGLKKIGGVNIISLLELNMPMYKKKECPLCKVGEPVLKPGSKRMQQ